MKEQSCVLGTAVIWIILGAAALGSLAAVLFGLLKPVAPDSLVLHYFSEPFLSRAAAYQRTGLGVYLLRQLVVVTFLGAAALAALRHWQAAPRVSVLAAAGLILLFLLLINLVTLPLSFYRGFLVEHSFGLSNHTTGSWLADYVKSLLLSLIISTAALTGLYWLMLRRPGSWWLWAGLAFAFFLLLASYLYPLVVDPLFYRFTPLEDEVLHERIVAMAADAGIGVEQVLVADASRRTQKVNAYFTGLGGTKRIVVFDTLLQRFEREEVLAVIAHEMGHWRCRHIFKGVLLGALGGLITLLLFKLVLHWMGLAPDLRAVPLALLFFTLVSLGTAPLQNAVSRGFERQADREALRLTEDPETFIALKQKMALANLSAVRPHPLVKYVLYTHPPVMERIEEAINYSGRGAE